MSGDGQSTEDAVIILERAPFQADAVSRLLGDNLELKLQLKNDIYGVYHLTPPPDLNGEAAGYMEGPLYDICLLSVNVDLKPVQI